MYEEHESWQATRPNKQGTTMLGVFINMRDEQTDKFGYIKVGLVGDTYRERCIHKLANQYSEA